MEYLDSLEKNQAKECVKQEHVQLSLRGRAQQDVYEEPLITVSWRHLSLRVHTHRFPKRSSMPCCAIYDWVGFLSLTPQYFTLSSILTY